MSNSKKYYYMRLKEDYFDNPKIIVLESMKDGYLFSNILLKMYLLSLKTDGRLMVNNIVPYNAEMLSAITRHQAGTVERALKAFEALDLIEVIDQGAIYMTEIQTLIGKTSTEADRIREYRNRIDEEKGVQMYDKCTPENREQSIEIKEQSIEFIDYRTLEDKKTNNKSKKLPVANMSEANVAVRPNPAVNDVYRLYIEICQSLPKITKMTAERTRHVNARLNEFTVDDFRTVFEKAEASDFCRGNNDRGWKATFDFLISESGFTKTLEGKYDNRDGKHDSSDPVYISPLHYRDSRGEFTTDFTRLPDGTRKCVCRYGDGSTREFTYTDETRPAWIN